MQTILIFGATSSIAQACMHVWAQRKQVNKFVCVARNAAKLNAFIYDFLIRYPTVEIESHIVDFHDLDCIHTTIEQCFHQKIDQILIAQGVMFNNESDLSVKEIESLLQVNTISVAITTDCIYKYLQQQGSGIIGIIGSVAGDRGRKVNYLYGASKSFVATYVEGLQHKAALNNENIQISLIKPGPTASAMTQYLMASGKKLANVNDVARDIVLGMQKSKRVIYTPKIWQIIMFIIRHIPFFLFKKMDL